MVIGLGTFMKLAKGGLGPDELGEILGAAGMQVSIEAVQPVQATFRELIQAGSLPGAHLSELKGSMKDGSRIYALFIVTESSDSNHSAKS